MVYNRLNDHRSKAGNESKVPTNMIIEMVTQIKEEMSCVAD